MKSFFRSKFFWFFLIGLFFGIGIWKFLLNGATQTMGSQNGKKSTTYTVKKGTINETMTISGTLDADETVSLRFQSSGLISWMGVKTGDQVKKGQLIATLDQVELQKNLQKYLNTYMSSRWNYDQTKDEYRQPDQGYWGLTWDQRNDVDRALQKAQFDLNNSVLDVELKEIALKYANLYSPIDGIVTSVASPVAGVYVSPTQGTIGLVNPDSLYFSLLPDQTEVTKLSASMSANIIFDSYPEETELGTIERISFTPKEGESSTVYEVKIKFPMNDTTHDKYRLGMTGDATFTTRNKEDVLIVPITYVKNDKDKKYVMKKMGTKKEKTYVEIGIESDELVEITGGLAEGDVIYD